MFNIENLSRLILSFDTIIGQSRKDMLVCLINWLVYTACQPIKSYSMHRGYHVDFYVIVSWKLGFFAHSHMNSSIPI